MARKIKKAFAAVSAAAVTFSSLICFQGSIWANAEEFDSMIVLTTNDFVETLEIDKNNANIISYVLHPIVLKHPEYQTEKIIQILSLFEDKSSTFYVEFITDNPLKAFI